MLTALFVFPNVSKALSEDDVLDQFNVEQVLLFLVPHLKNSLDEAGVLKYRFEEQTFNKRGRRTNLRFGRVVLFVQHEPKRGGVHSAIDFLKGEHDSLSVEIPDSGGNPVVTTFLQWDVNRMATTINAHPDYFRHLIRYAMASRAIHHEDMSISHKGQTIQAVMIVFKPFASDIVQSDHSLKHLAHKEYEFIVAPKISGGIYSITTSIKADAKSSSDFLERVHVEFKDFSPEQ
ncbi:MAG: hypothetical protein ACNYNY_03785 [Candidatus Oxydemutatoraceae bacterium WSBS_2016_MAG_OTU14]